MTIGFLTQYYRGLGHAQRIKFIAQEKTAENNDVVVMDQLFQYNRTLCASSHFYVSMSPQT